MHIKLWMIAGVVLTTLLTLGLAGEAQAQVTARGYCAGPWDRDCWTVRVTPGYVYTIWVRADDPAADCDLYVYDCRNNLICSGWPSCTFFATCSTYVACVICARPTWYTIGVF